MSVIEFREHRLANGLRVMAERNPRSHSFAAGFFVRVGSRDEPLAVHGVSHFLEHMMFKGNERMNWEAMNRTFDELGSRYNAYTTQELTAYYANVIPELARPVLAHLAELMRPALAADVFELERKVILEEIAMYNDDPAQRVFERAVEVHFGDDPLGRPIIGTEQSIRAMTRDQMAEFHREHYRPGNMVLSLAGRFEFDEIAAWTGELFSGLGEVDRTGPTPRPPAKSIPNGAESMIDAKLNRFYQIGLMPGPSAQDRRRYAARVLGDVIGDDDGSRLFWALVDSAVADEADFGFYPHDGVGSFYLSLVTDPERSAEAFEIAMKELRRVRDDLGEDEVERAKNKLLTSVTLGGESPMGRMRTIGSEWAYTGTYRSIDDELAQVESVSRGDLIELLDGMDFDSMTRVTLGRGD